MNPQPNQHTHSHTCACTCTQLFDIFTYIHTHIHRISSIHRVYGAAKHHKNTNTHIHTHTRSVATSSPLNCREVKGGSTAGEEEIKQQQQQKKQQKKEKYFKNFSNVLKKHFYPSVLTSYDVILQNVDRHSEFDSVSNHTRVTGQNRPITNEPVNRDLEIRCLKNKAETDCLSV